MGTTIFAVLLILSGIASMTNSGGDKESGEEKYHRKYTFLMGPLFPSGSTGLNESIATVGLKYSMAIKDPTEFTIVGGNEKGQSFYLAMISIKNEINAIDEKGLTPFYYFGLQGAYYHSILSNGSPAPFRTGVGIHLGFGIDVKINHYLSLRNDYVFAIGPGKVLNANLGLQYTF